MYRNTIIMVQLTDQTFKEQIQEGVVVVDMYADWCGPCRALSPILEELEEKYSSVTFAKLDTDANRSMPQEYGVMGIPAVFIFKDGELVKRIDGYNPKSVYIDVLESI